MFPSLFKKAKVSKPVLSQNSRTQKQSQPQCLQLLPALFLKRALRNLLFKRWLLHVKSKRKILKFLKSKKKILGEFPKLPCYKLHKYVKVGLMRSKGEKLKNGLCYDKLNSGKYQIKLKEIEEI